MSFLRVREATKAEVKLMLTGAAEGAGKIADDNELRAMQQLRKICAQLLRGYQHTPSAADTQFRDTAPVEDVLALRMVASEQVCARYSGEDRPSPSPRTLHR